MRNIVIFGNSNAGKDTLAELIQRELEGYKIFHPHYYHRDHLEDIYGLARGTLRTKAGKLQKAPGANSTYANMLEDSYHFWLKHDPDFNTRVMKRSFDVNQKHIIIGVRNLAEGNFIRSLARTRQISIDLCLWITANDEIQKNTDTYQSYMFQDLRRYSRKAAILINEKKGLDLMSAEFNSIWNKEQV